MTDVAANLRTLDFESGLSVDERQFLFLRARASAKTICGCAHATFFCKLLHTVRKKLLKGSASVMSKPSSMFSSDAECLKVGIIGGGHIGKQLVHALLEVACLKPSAINVSSRRPETLEDLEKLEVKCFYNNGRLAAWADVLFLCCLPSHLSHVCAEIQHKLNRTCVVYSFVSAVPVLRLQQLLSHNMILRPEYNFTSESSGEVWLTKCGIVASLRDPVVIEATCPFRENSGISLSKKWPEAVLYSLLNMCTAMHLASKQTISIINELLLLQGTSAVYDTEQVFQFKTQSFVSTSFASGLSDTESFPWLSLVEVQKKETPLSKTLSDEYLQRHLSTVYFAALGVPEAERKEEYRENQKAIRWSPE
ncbi:NADP-dependent oxidoreductase domain-containing protein 1 isoform X2 [Erpetoichthys calabaricus]|nr:NADP-dependent oxidoreductase domain-containing protein 1 isoform X2 [Erpetoichthys calabaricus]